MFDFPPSDARILYCLDCKADLLYLRWRVPIHDYVTGFAVSTRREIIVLIQLDQRGVYLIHSSDLQPALFAATDDRERRSGLGVCRAD